MRTDQFILASQSIQRRSLLEAAGYDFQILPADIDEYSFRNSNLRQRACDIAEAKLQAIRALHSERTVITADSFVVCNGVSYEKPETVAEAAQMIQVFSGNSVEHITALCYSDPKQGINYSQAIISHSHFRALDETEIQRYVAHNPVTTWSGGFSPAYDAGACLITHIDGSLTGCTHGIPMEIVIPLLNESGYVPHFTQ